MTKVNNEVSSKSLNSEVNMVEIESTPDPVRLSYLQAVLADAGLESFVFDANSPWPGAMQKRLLVAEDDAELARQAISTADSTARA
jgi:Putative prokaryotic signal transducing protein